MGIEAAVSHQAIQPTPGKPAPGKPAPSASEVAKAKETKQAFSEFVGKTFYGQLMKSMRKTVDKPAYFNGGRAEEAFRGQLDQAIADHMSESDGAKLADSMFSRQFPHAAGVLRRAGHADPTQTNGLDQLSTLRRR